jgi:nucleotide-binding universal stress UspA family protein
MFRKILLPLDLTDKHQSALKIAEEMAVQSGGEIVLLHVIEALAGWPDEEIQEFYSRIEQKAQEHLHKYGQQLQDKNIRWHAKVITGSRVRAVVDYAVEGQADLILLSSPKFDPSTPSEGWASLSWKISILAPCPVLLVK